MEKYVWIGRRIFFFFKAKEEEVRICLCMNTLEEVHWEEGIVGDRKSGSSCLTAFIFFYEIVK